jgi:sugar-phosphatase
MELSYAAVCFDLFGTLVDADGTPVPGAREALAALAGARWAIVTSCGFAYAHVLIAAAGLPEPRVLVSSDEVERGKPAPEPYAAGARALGVESGECVAVEDRVDGIESARGAGMDVIAILRGRGLAFARRATFQVGRFSAMTWSTQENGSIRVRIEP